MSLQGATSMVPDPTERYLEQERRLHTQSLALEKYRFRTSNATNRARTSLVAILALTAATGLIVVSLAARPIFGVVVWLAFSLLACGGIGYVLARHRKQLTGADEELQAALSSADERHAEAHG